MRTSKGGTWHRYTCLISQGECRMKTDVTPCLTDENTGALPKAKELTANRNRLQLSPTVHT